MFVARDAVDYLEAHDVASLDLAGVRAGLVHTAKLRAFADAAEAKYVARMRQLTVDVTGELRDLSGVSTRSARHRIRNADALCTLPATLDALAGGEITSEHVEVIARAVQNNPTVAGHIKAHETVLLDHVGSVEEFTRTLNEFVASTDPDPNAKAVRQHQNRRVWFNDGPDDMSGGGWMLPPVLAKQVNDAITREARRMWREHNQRTGDPGDAYLARHHPQYLADALVTLTTRTTSAGRGAASSGVRAGVGVLALWHIDHVTSQLDNRGVATRLADGTPLAPETLRRLACTHGVINGIVDDTGAVLAMGRKTRTATPEQRVVLEAMWGGCINCGAAFAWCDMHHFPQWHHGGLTDTDKLVPVCDSRCHQLFHEGGWTLTSPHHGVIDIHTPNGQHHKRITANQVIANAHAPPTAA